jgi:hypothetical protein
MATIRAVTLPVHAVLGGFTAEVVNTEGRYR